MLHLPQKILFSFLLALILGAFVAAIPAAVLPVEGQVISDEWINDIESYLLEVDKNTTAEIVIYVLDSLYGHGITKDGTEINDITQLGVYIFNKLSLDSPSGAVVGIGKKGKDNGVLVLVAIADREWRIEVGYGLEGYITDVESNRIAQDYLVPNFQEGNYCKGLLDTVDALAKEIPDATEKMPTRGRYVYGNAELPAEEELPWWVILLIIIFVIFMITFGGRLGGGRVGGGWGGSGGGGGGRSGGGGGGGRSGGGGSGGKW